LLELLDRMNPSIEELTRAIEQEAKKWPEVLRLMTHPGVGPLTALGLRADHRNAGAVQVRQADRQLCRTDPEDLREEDIKTIDFGYGNIQLRQCFGDMRRVESRAQIYAPTARGIQLNLLRTVTCRTTNFAKTLVRWAHRPEPARKALRNQLARQHYKYWPTLPDRSRGLKGRQLD
jgi:transposase